MANQHLVVQAVPALHCQQQTTSIEPKGKQIPESSSQTACRPVHRQIIVRFSRDAIQEHSINRRQDLSVEEINETWYNREEYADIREEIRSTIKLLRAGLTDPERVGFCYRGLEHKTSERGKQRSLNIVQSVEAVLVPQKRMQLEGTIPDPSAIADGYCAISLQCQNDAHIVGLWDEKSVKLMWRVQADQLPRMPRRTWAKGA
jgi:hypothetical protein